MNTTELPLPKKIFPVEYAGFFDFNEEGVYDISVINRDDYPNAEQIANEISKRYNNFDDLSKFLRMVNDCLNDGIPIEKDDPIHNIAKKLLESLK